MSGRSAILLTLLLGLSAIAGPACIGTGSSASQQGAAVADSTEAPASPRTFTVDSVVMPWGEVRYDTIYNTKPQSAHAAAHAAAQGTPHATPVLPGWEDEGAAMAEADKDSRYTTLTDEDFRKVAAELGVEVAAIKAVVRIEAGAAMEGFFAPGVPIINFDRSMYNKARPTSNVKAPASEKVPAGIKSAYGRKEWGQLVAARKVNRDKANMGTFWGMFQIGGFNYKLCGCETVQEMVDRMSYSEFEQLELFANFITNSGMLADLKAKNWSGFARKYNGASYRARGYHTKMANAYAKYKAQEK